MDPSPLLRHTLLTPPRLAALAPDSQRAGQPGRVDDSAARKGGSLRDRIVGTWLVTYEGPVAGQAFIQWHSDGTEWENIDLPARAETSAWVTGGSSTRIT